MIQYFLLMNCFHAHSKKVETKFRQRLVTDGRVSAQDASAATWVIGRAAAEQRWQCKKMYTYYQRSHLGNTISNRQSRSRAKMAEQAV